MKLMVVLSRFPQPIDKGDKLRAYHQIKHLSKNNELYLFCISDNDASANDINHLRTFCKEVHVYSISFVRRIWNMISYSFSGQPFQAGYFYSPVIHQQIRKQAERIKPDNILFQLIRTAKYAEGIYAPTLTIDYMDAFSKGYERMAGTSSGLLKILYLDEAKRLKSFEETVYHKFHKHIIISEQDKDLLGAKQRQQIKVITNGVDTDYFAPGLKTKSYSLLFHGNMNYTPNVKCAVSIANNILPELARRKRDVTLLVSGASPHKKVLNLATHKNITVTGWVDDVRSSYNQSHIFIAPVEIGTGIQNKILEAMAMGVPCVVSPLVANALNLQHNEHVLIGSDTVEYCDFIEMLMDNEQLYYRIANNALNLVKAGFKWQDTVSEMEQYLSNKH